MTRIYSDRTGIYLGLIMPFRDVWISEDRQGTERFHDTEAEAIARLERQPEHRDTAA